MANRTFVVGVGMTKFEKPGSRDWEYPDMAREAVGKALEDAGVGYHNIGLGSACAVAVYKPASA